MPGAFILPPRLREEMLENLARCLPEEGCGLIGGRFLAQQVMAAMVLAVPNALHSPVRFRMAPEAQLQAFYAIEARGLELVAIYHSHPTGPDGPSETDLDEFAYPGVLSLIVSPSSEGWQIRAFWIDGKTVINIPVWDTARV